MLIPKMSTIFNNFDIFEIFFEKKKENVVSIQYLYGGELTHTLVSIYKGAQIDHDWQPTFHSRSKFSEVWNNAFSSFFFLIKTLNQKLWITNT